MTRIHTLASSLRSQLGRSITFGCSALLVTCALLACSCKVKKVETEAPPPPEETPAKPDAPAESAGTQEEAQPRAEFKPLVGAWLREDGGYVLRIEAVEPDGKLKASYFNPRPINVSRAAAVKEDGSVKVGVELNDTGYPGCLYNLILDTSLDQLTGTYFQAQMQETWPVVFVRQQQ